MSNNNNQLNIPQAKEAMNKFKMEVANEIGVPLTNGYNGNLTSAQNGSVGGGMVRKTQRMLIISGCVDTVFCIYTNFTPKK